MVDEGENPFGVVSGDEFCGLAHIVHVCAVGGAGHLPGIQGESPTFAVPELPNPCTGICGHWGVFSDRAV